MDGVQQLVTMSANTTTHFLCNEILTCAKNQMLISFMWMTLCCGITLPCRFQFPSDAAK